MIKERVTVKDPQGLHIRVASELVRICSKHEASVSFRCADCPEAQGCSIISLLLLKAQPGTELTVTAQGRDAAKVIKEISHYFGGGGI